MTNIIALKFSKQSICFWLTSHVIQTTSNFATQPNAAPINVSNQRPKLNKIKNRFKILILEILIKI